MTFTLLGGIYYVYIHRLEQQTVDISSKKTRVAGDQVVEVEKNEFINEESFDESFLYKSEEPLSFSDDFSASGSFAGGYDMSESVIPNWWLNSGGYYYVENGVGKTIQGELPKDDKQRLKYYN